MNNLVVKMTCMKLLFSCLKAKPIITSLITILLTGCYSLDQYEFCIFGKGSFEDADHKNFILVNADNKEVSGKKYASLLKSSNELASSVINGTYDLAEEQCDGNRLTEERYNKFHNIAEVFIFSRSIEPWSWSQGGIVQEHKLHEALRNEDANGVVAETYCVIGLCNREKYEAFCKSKNRESLNNKFLQEKLSQYFLSKKGYRQSYKIKNVSYCKGPKW